MRVHILASNRSVTIDNLILLRHEGKDPIGRLQIPAALRMVLARAIGSVHHSGKDGESIQVGLDTAGIGRVTLVGLGKAEKFSLKKIRAAIRAAVRQAGKNGDKKVAIGVTAPLVGPGSDWENLLLLEACLLSDYEYRVYRTTGDAPRYPDEIRWVPRTDDEEETLEATLKEAKVVADSVRAIRDLGNAPSNDLTPTKLADAAREFAREFDFKCTVLGRKELEKEGFGGLLAVNRGSAEEPAFIIMDYAGPAKGRKPKETIVLVGKGLTFDSGGISIKPAAGMGEMKYDMCGAAAVLGSVRAAAALKLPFRVVGLVSSAENMPDGKAYKPGDIIRTLSGKTVEIDNTDAEGRVVLADALHYAKRFEPSAVVDFATLTGACMVALGLECSGLMSPDDSLSAQLVKAGEESGERLWRLPLWDDYRENLRSDWADIKNTGPRWAGAINGGIFLKEFAEGLPWAHLDIAGTANYEREFGGLPIGASGVGVKLMVRFLKGRSSAA